MSGSAVPGDPHLWVVLSEEGEPAFASTFSALAHAHINDMIDAGIDDSHGWIVREYMRVLSRQEVDELAGEGVDTQQYINSLRRTIEGQRKHIASLERRCREYRGDD